MKTFAPKFGQNHFSSTKERDLPAKLKFDKVHPTFRVMRQSCKAKSLNLKYFSSLNP